MKKSDYAIQIQTSAKLFSLRKRFVFDRGDIPYDIWRYYDKRNSEWVGGLGEDFEKDPYMCVPIETEEEALLIILTGQWKGRRMIP